MTQETEPTPKEPEVQPLMVGLVRDKNGVPIFDRPLSEYPPKIRAALEALMTEEEIARVS